MLLTFVHIVALVEKLACRVVDLAIALTPLRGPRRRGNTATLTLVILYNLVLYRLPWTPTVLVAEYVVILFMYLLANRVTKQLPESTNIR